MEFMRSVSSRGKDKIQSETEGKIHEKHKLKYIKTQNKSVLKCQFRQVNSTVNTFLIQFHSLSIPRELNQ